MPSCEMALARRIESTYDKETIITCYLNRVFPGAYLPGLKQAAHADKLPRDLTVGEAAMLAGIICSPNQFSPTPQPRFLRRCGTNKVLKLMYEHNKITHNACEYASRNRW